MQVGDSQFEIELNRATREGGPRYVHLQNASGRLNLTEREFLQVAAILGKAAKKLRSLKQLED